MKIKLIKEEDFEQLAVLFYENNLEAVIKNFSPFPLTRETAQWIALKEHQDKYFLGFIDKKIIGFSMLRGWENGYSVPSFGMFIDHQHHGMGLGKQLLELTIEAAIDLECKKIRLSVYAGNNPAYKIYKSGGFKEVERSEIRHNGLLDEQIIMLKELD